MIIRMALIFYFFQMAHQNHRTNSLVSLKCQRNLEISNIKDFFEISNLPKSLKIQTFFEISRFYFEISKKS